MYDVEESPTYHIEGETELLTVHLKDACLLYKSRCLPSLRSAPSLGEVASSG